MSERYSWRGLLCLLSVLFSFTVPAAAASRRGAAIVITLPEVGHSSRPGESTWLSCRVPAAAIVRVKAIHPQQTALWLFRPAKRVTAGQWAVWQIPRPRWMGETFLLELHVTPRGPQPAGAVFVVSYGDRPTPAGLNATYGRTGVQPNPARPPSDRTGEFGFGLSRDADVLFTIRANTAAVRPPLHERTLRDLPRGFHRVRWDLKVPGGVWAPPGGYVAATRLRRVPGACRPRESGGPTAHVVTYFTIARNSAGR